MRGATDISAPDEATKGGGSTAKPAALYADTPTFELVPASTRDLDATSCWPALGTARALPRPLIGSIPALPMQARPTNNITL